MKIAIVGAGISGLSTGFYIKKLFREKGFEVQIKIYEAAKRPGGTIWSERIDGFLLEWGPNGFLDNKPSTLELSRLLGIGDQMIKSNSEAARRYIYTGKKLYLLPENPLKFLKSGLISPWGKLRIFLEVLIPKKKNDEDESVASFVRRRLGKEALEKLVGPMVSGVFAGDPERLSLKGAFPRIYQLEKEYGSLIRAMVKLKRGGSPPGILTSFKEGMVQLVKALTKELEENLLVGREVLQAKKEGDKWVLEGRNFKEEFDAIVFAIPAYVLGKIFPYVFSQCKTIEYPPLHVVHLGLERKKVEKFIDGFGFLTTKKAKSRVLGVLFASKIFNYRSPKDFHLLTAMIGGALDQKTPMLDDQALIEAVLEELKRILKIEAKPDFVKIIRHEKAIPQYPLGHTQTTLKVEETLFKAGGAFLAGNAFYGIGVNDCTRRAKEVAEQVLNYVKEKMV